MICHFPFPVDSEIEVESSKKEIEGLKNETKKR